MSIRFHCPVCKTAYTVNEQDAGKKAECKVCGQRVQVPSRPGPSSPRTKLGEPIDPPAQLSERSREVIARQLTVDAAPGDWWLYSHREDQKTAVTYDQLRSMARDGSLRRRDFVKRKGKRVWGRAGRYLDLWTPPDANESLLTTCRACLGQIAKEAPACPKCGAPNGWLHPEVVRFLKRRRSFESRYDNFSSEAQGYMLVCRSVRPKQFLDYAASAVGSLGFVGPLSVSGLAVILGASIGSEYAADVLREKAGPGTNVLVIDFRHNPPVWSSTNNEFWEYALEVFDVF